MDLTHEIVEQLRPRIRGPLLGSSVANAASYGSKRGQRVEPFRTLQSRGVLWSGASDYFVTPMAARFGLWASIARQTAKATCGLHPSGWQRPWTSTPPFAATPPDQRLEMPFDPARRRSNLHFA